MMELMLESGINTVIITMAINLGHRNYRVFYYVK